MGHCFRSAAISVLLMGLLSWLGSTGADASGKPLVADANANEANIPPTYVVEGTVRPAANNDVDGDVNDPLAPFQSNDTQAAAQPIPNPVTLGGYANIAGTGPAGRSQAAGDQNDWYRVTLTADQIIALYVAADGRVNDLDLGLFDLDGNLIDASLGQGRFEALSVTRSGMYLLLVQPFRGASNYVLTVGQQTVGSIKDGRRLSDPFVPGEAIVRFHDDALVQKRGLPALAQAAGWMTKAGDAARNALLALPAHGAAGGPKTFKGGAGVKLWQQHEMSATLRLKLYTLLRLKTLAQRADVRYAAPNYLRQSMFVPNDERFPLQWQYPFLVLPQAWEITSGGGATVAVVDTGVLLSHPDLQGQLVGGYDFISDPLNAADGDGIDPNPNDPGDAAVAGTSSFHGTHISGTVAAVANNATGVAGVAFDARIMPLRVLGRDGGTDYDIEQAVRFAAGLPNDSGTIPPQFADVINLSLGGPGFSEASQAVYTAARNAGVVIVAAAGNAGVARPFYPASYGGVISVGAVDMDKTLAPYSNTGPTIDVTAPGGNMTRDINGDGHPDGILSTAATDADGAAIANYLFFQGTSMAAGHVSGVLALMRATYPGLTPAVVDTLLANGSITEDLGAPGRDDRFGHGLINAYRAVAAASNGAGMPLDSMPILTVTPPALNFGPVNSSFTVRVANGGGGSLVVNPPEEDSMGWLSLNPRVGTDGLGAYQVNVERSGLAEGIYTATLSFTSTANRVEVPIRMQVLSEASGPSDAGQQYVVLVDAATLETVLHVPAVRRQDGSYSYRFSGVPAGVYRIVAGTDSDNDGLICGSGEACGGYLTLDDPVAVQVDGNRSGLDFVTSFSASLPTTQGTRIEAGGFSRRSRPSK